MQSDMTFLYANLSHFHSLLNLLYSSFSPSLHTSSLLALPGYWYTSKEPEHRSGESSSFLPNVYTHMHVRTCMYVFVCLFMHTSVRYAYILCICMCVYMYTCLCHVLWKEIALWESTWLGLGGFSLSFYVCRNYQNSRWLYSYFILILPGQKWNQMPACSSEF